MHTQQFAPQALPPDCGHLTLQTHKMSLRVLMLYSLSCYVTITDSMCISYFTSVLGRKEAAVRLSWVRVPEG